MKYRRTWAILGILATIIWLLLRPSESEAVASKKAASSSTSRAAPLRTGMEKPERHSQAAESQGQHHQHFSRHDANQLKDFILPHLDGKEVSLREALDLLHEAYLEACFHSQEKPLALKFTIKDEPDRPISFSLRGRSFLTCLNHLAALSGLLVERNELSFELFRSETADHPRDIVFRYAPHTKEWLRTQGEVTRIGKLSFAPLDSCKRQAHGYPVRVILSKSAAPKRKSPGCNPASLSRTPPPFNSKFPPNCFPSPHR